MSLPRIIVSGAFDDLRTRDLRFLEEASKLGEVSVLLWPDELISQSLGAAPKFPLAERSYLLKAIRFVTAVLPAHGLSHADELPASARANIWADIASAANPAREAFCRANGISYRVFQPEELAGFPVTSSSAPPSQRKKAVVTGCFDWLHSGHVRFFEEVSAWGDLYVIVGHDANIRLLKGAGHPLLPQDERRYLVGSIRYVTQALISSGEGWLDADPEIQRLKPDIYAVNEDGDKGGKREYCEKLGLQYLVLKRTPAPGLPPRSSTTLRGF
jgi:cytidyltransferase-like protein